jgi:outer membrane protein assembly factor BamE (lipoprotein component of BamABCDE complex)
MLHISTRRSVNALLVLVASILVSGALTSVTRAQNAVQKPTQAGPPAAQLEEPRYREYRRVRLGMTEAEVHSALGTPKESEGRQEFYALSDTEMAQVFYDARRNVWAITVSYLGGQGNAPTPEQIFGGPVEVKPDGSVYKMVKYERAGYYVAYSRDAGDAPFMSVIMQKLPD